MLHMRLELSSRRLQHYIIQPPCTTLTTTLTRHLFVATLLEYIASEMSAALKRKMFGMSEGGELGHLRMCRGWPVTTGHLRLLLIGRHLQFETVECGRWNSAGAAVISHVSLAQVYFPDLPFHSSFVLIPESGSDYICSPSTISTLIMYSADIFRFWAARCISKTCFLCMAWLQVKSWAKPSQMSWLWINI